MAYEPTIWKDRVVEKPRTFNIVNNPDGTVTLVPAPGVVVEEGTPVNAANLNKLEQGLKTHEAEKASDNLGHVLLSEVENTWRKIEKLTLDANIKQIDFTVPTDYKEFRIIGINLKSSSAETQLYCRFNNDNNANYYTHSGSMTGQGIVIGAIDKNVDGIVSMFDMHIISKPNSPVTTNVFVKSKNTFSHKGGSWTQAQINTINITVGSYLIASGAIFEIWGRK